MRKILINIGERSKQAFAQPINTYKKNKVLSDYLKMIKKNNIGVLSGLAWGGGYVGAVIALAIVLAVFILPEKPIFSLHETRTKKKSKSKRRKKKERGRKSNSKSKAKQCRTKQKQSKAKRE